MDPLQILQAAVAGLVTQLNNGTVNNVAQNATASPTSVASPLNLPGLLSFMLSFSALRDWLKLLVIGGAIETCRRMCIILWVSFVESFWITACFDETDVSYSEWHKFSSLPMTGHLYLRHSLAFVLAVQTAQVG